MPSTITNMRSIAILVLLAAPLAAEWQKVNAGPFEIYTDQDVRAAKDLLGDLEQLRHQVEALTGVQDPKPLWPIRIVIAKNQRPGSLTLTTSFQSLVLPTAALNRTQRKQVAVALLHPNSGPLEPSLEDALLSVLAGLESSGSRVTLGALPPAAEQNADWVLVNYLVTNESYRGRLRVFLGNLMRGADQASALRNGFEQNEAKLREEAAAARAAFAPVTFAAKPILPERDYRAREVEAAEARLELAIASGDAKACAPSKELAALECVAVNSTDAASALEAIDAGSKNARMYYLAAIRQPERLEHQRRLFTALQLKPLYPDAAFAFSLQENDPMKALKALKDASPAAQRDAKYLSQLATIAERAAQYGDSAKAWAAAERAAFDPSFKETLRQSRLRTVDQRLEAEAQARRAAEAARIADIERVRQESLARVRLAEAKARATLTPLDPNEKVMEWFDGEQANAYFVGTLTRIECLGQGKARFAVQGESETMLFDVPDPSKIVVSGAGAETLQFSCGQQKSPRRLRAGYLSAQPLAVLPPETAKSGDPNFKLKAEPEGQLIRRPSPDEEPSLAPYSAPAVPKPAPVVVKTARAAKPSPTAGRLLTLEMKP